MKDIVTLMLDQLKKRLNEQDLDFTMSDKAIEKIAEEGFDPEYGARPLRRSIQKNIEDMLSEALLREEIKKGETTRIGLNSKGKFIILNA
jgi:ATP-dependent Clp protease ATP-binding subunit ClpC